MEFLQYNPTLNHKPNPSCTIFNYDIYVLLCKDGPVLFDCSIGGYIDPNYGGTFNPPNWDIYVEAIKELKPLKLIIPECVVNNYYPEVKQLYETTIKDLGYNSDKLLVFIQKEQKYYYNRPEDVSDWFFKQPIKYKNMVYHSIGYNEPKSEPDKSLYKGFTLCKQGFLCESFRKLYFLKDLTIDKIYDHRKQTNYEYGKFVWYGNPGTRIREVVFKSLHDTDLYIEQHHYGDENLLDWVLNRNGIGLSIDGLVYHTIRDTELSMYGVPNIKITSADNNIITGNNLDLFGSRSVLHVDDTDIDEYNLPTIYKQIKNKYDEYMSTDLYSYDATLKQIRYQFFITLLQKYHSIEFFVYDILFNEHMQEFIDTLDMDVDLSIFSMIASPEVLDTNMNIQTEFLDMLHNRFTSHFKQLYNNWVSLNTNNGQDI